MTSCKIQQYPPFQAFQKIPCLWTADVAWLMVVELVTTSGLMWKPQGHVFLMLQCLSVSVAFPSPHYDINIPGAKGKPSSPWLTELHLRSCHSLIKRCDGASDSGYFYQSTSYHGISVFVNIYSFGQSFPSRPVTHCWWRKKMMLSCDGLGFLCEFQCWCLWDLGLILQKSH